MLNISLLLLACDICKMQSASLCAHTVVSPQGHHHGWPKALLWATQWQRTNFISDTHNIMFVPGSGSRDFHSGRINNMANRLLHYLQRWSLIDMVIKCYHSWSSLKAIVEDNHLTSTLGKDVKNVREEKYLQLSCRFTPRLHNRRIKTLQEEAELGGFGGCAVLLLSAVIYQ